MCPLGGALIDGEGGLLRKGKIIAHCLLIEAGDELVLVDTGYGTEDCVNPGRLGAQFRVSVMPQCRVEETAIRQVEALGRDPTDVRHIVATHLDRDHAGGLGDFPGAQVHVFADELAAHRADATRRFKRYLHAQTAHGPSWVEHRTEGDSWFGFESVGLLPDLDAEIALIPLRGHSAGMCGVAINTAEGWFLHCADAFFFRGEIETPRRCTPALRIFERKMDHDTKLRFENLGRLQELAREHGDEVTLICSHDAKMLEEAQAAMSPASAAGLN
jgi:glyoxylase-like metal-dependent hydrolase (beta-lactamase superfamily II)